MKTAFICNGFSVIPVFRETLPKPRETRQNLCQFRGDSRWFRAGFAVSGKNK